MTIEFPLSLTLPFSLSLFFSQVSGPLFHLPSGSFYDLIPLLPQFGAIQRNKEDIAAGTRVPTATVKDFVKPEKKKRNGIMSAITEESGVSIIVIIMIVSTSSFTRKELTILNNDINDTSLIGWHGWECLLASVPGMGFSTPGVGFHSPPCLRLVLP